MNRGLTGRYETSQIGGERVRAYIPKPLPPVPSLDLTGARQVLLEQALLALGRLDSVPTKYPLCPPTTLGCRRLYGTAGAVSS